jgi:hypothetical protein
MGHDHASIAKVGTISLSSDGGFCGKWELVHIESSLRAPRRRDALQRGIAFRRHFNSGLARRRGGGGLSRKSREPMGTGFKRRINHETANCEVARPGNLDERQRSGREQTVNSQSGLLSEVDTIIRQIPAFRDVGNQVHIILQMRKTLETPQPFSFMGAHLIHLVFILISLFGISHRAFAQTASASIRGTVADQSGGRIRDVRITLRSVDTGVERTTATDAAGTFSLTSVPPGDYTVRAVKEGFDTTEKIRVELFVAQAVTIDLVLRIGSPQSTLTVVANLSSVDSTTSELGTVIATTPVDDLPLNGRNFTQLLTLAPGISPISVAQNSGGGSGWGGNALGAFTFPAVNGQRNRSNMFLVDGITDLAFLGNYNYAPIIDDIQEFKLQSHSDLAEVGAVAGGIVNVVTKQGTNTFHGSAWEFLRNEHLDSRNYFLAARNPLRQNQFGVAAGGPVLIPRLYDGRNKMFFFFAYEGFRQSQATQNVVLVPTAAELGGNFGSLLSQGVQLYNPYSTAPDAANPGEYTRQPFVGNIIPSSLLSPAAELYATLFPAAGAAIPGGNLYDTTKALQRQDSFTGRMDRAFASRDRLYGPDLLLHRAVEQFRGLSRRPEANRNLRLERGSA